MSHNLTKRQIKSIKKMLEYDYRKVKELKKKKQEEKAKKLKGKRHKSKQLQIAEILQEELRDDR